MPTLNIGISSAAAKTGGAEIRNELRLIQNEARKTYVWMSKIGQVKQFRAMRQQIDETYGSHGKYNKVLDTGIKSTKQYTETLRAAMREHDRVALAHARLSKSVAKTTGGVKNQIGWLNTWIGKWSIMASGIAATIFILQNVYLLIRKLIQVWKEWADAVKSVKIRQFGESAKYATNMLKEFQTQSRLSWTDAANAIEIFTDRGDKLVDMQKAMHKAERLSMATGIEYGKTVRELTNIMDEYGLSANEVEKAITIYQIRNKMLIQDVETLADAVENKGTTALKRFGGQIKENLKEGLGNLATAVGMVATSFEFLDRVLGKAKFIWKFFEGLTPGIGWAKTTIKSFVRFTEVLIKMIAKLKGTFTPEELKQFEEAALGAFGGQVVTQSIPGSMQTRYSDQNKILSGKRLEALKDIAS
ncbi:MAG: hypothetical protein MIO92_09065, partial [Methanosarcinaceae archaeon]|nr:hypothetical protein [Methanosarcinaceae archaeon]